MSTYTNSSLHQGGWGQFLASYFTTKAKVDNRAIGGRTSRRFIEEGRLTDILDDARAGDYLFVQFGTNDSNKTATYDDGEPYYLAPDTDFKKYLQQYIDGAKAKAVIPVLVTPPPRNSCQSNGKTFNYSFGSYATAMYQLRAGRRRRRRRSRADGGRLPRREGGLRVGQRQLLPDSGRRHRRRHPFSRDRREILAGLVGWVSPTCICRWPETSK